MSFPPINKDISLFLGGHSVEEYIGHPFERIKKNTFTIAINHSFCKLVPHALVWQDYNVTKDLMLWVRSRKNKGHELPLLWSRHAAFLPKREYGVDTENLNMLRGMYKEIPKDNRSGSYTASLCINFLRKHYPSRKIYIFGLDMAGKDCWYDKYFEPLKRIKKCWDLTVHETWPKDKTCSKPVKFVRKAKDDLNPWVNDTMIYNMNKQSNYKHFKYKNWEEICQ